VKAAGYSPEAGFFAEDAARLGQAGIELINELIALVRTGILLRLAAETNARGGP
jgi:hypothetical protein